MSWFCHGSRAVAVLLVTAALVWMGAACGSGAVEGPDDEASSDSGGGDTGGSGNDGSGGDTGGDGDGGGRHSWSLPVGDISPDDSTILYYALRSSCDEGAEQLKESGGYPPALLKLYEAAIAICRGDIEGGRALYAAGAGDGGYATGCLVREAVLSVLDQRPQNISACPYIKIGEEETPSEEETPTTEGESTTSSTVGEETTITPSTVGGGDAPPESGGEGDEGA